jgi:glutaconate CoA-transferase, subunit B
VMAPDPVTRELTLVALHPGITVDQVRDATGWELKVAEKLGRTVAPDAKELATLRDLQARTAKAHGSVANE